MRVLPRTVRGTWALAAAAWAAGCAFFYWLLPVVPAFEVRLPGPQYLIGFGPEGRTLLTCDWPSFPGSSGGLPAITFTGPVGLWDAATGRQLATAFNSDPTLAEVKVSPDGRWLSAAIPTEHYYTLRLYELPALRLAAEAPCDTICPGTNFGLYSRDSRWLVFLKLTDGPRRAAAGLVAWDLAAGGEHTLRCQQLALVPLRGGRIATLADPTIGYPTDGEPAYWAAPRSDPLPTFVPLPCGGFIELGGHDGQAVPALVCDNVCLGRRAALVRETPGGATAERELDEPEECREFLLANSGRSILTLGRKDRVFRWWNRATGQAERAVAAAGYDGDHRVLGNVSPDGKTAVFGRPRQESRVLRWLARWVRPLARYVEPLSDSAGTVMDADTGQIIGAVPNFDYSFRWLPGGRRIAVPLQRGQLIQIWDVPPRKPLTWLAIVATALALPVAWLAGGRGRRLRALAGRTT